MAKAKKKTAAPELPRTSAALVHGDKAFGAKYVKPGFGITPEQDLKFALGWPNMFELVEGHEDDEAPEKSALKVLESGSPFLQTTWPKAVANRLARAFFLDGWFNFFVKPGFPTPFPVTLETLANPAPLTADEASRFIRDRFTSQSPNLIDKLVYFCEALVGPDVVAKAAFEALRQMPAKAAAGQDPTMGMHRSLRDGIDALGFVLLRLPAADRQRYMDEWSSLFSTWTAGLQPPATFASPILFASRRVLFPVEAARDGADPSHVLDDPAVVQQWRSARANDTWGFAPDPRLVFLGGEPVYRIERALWSKYVSKQAPAGTVHPLIVERFGAIRSPITVDLMLELANTSKAKKQAQAWFAANADFARPELERLAAAAGENAAWAKATLASL